jgi:hypothetical protein
MAHITTHSDDFRLSAPKFGSFELLLKFFADGIRDMNRYLNAASFVHSPDQPESVTSREQSWEGPL